MIRVIEECDGRVHKTTQDFETEVNELLGAGWTLLSVRCEFGLCAILEKKETKNPWIPCSKRLPDEYEHVLVTYSTEGKRYADDIAWREDKEWFWLNDNKKVQVDIIAWMSLPEPYEGGGER